MSGEDDSNGWQLTESDPGVFTALLKSLGTSLIVDDIHSLEPEDLAALQPLHALIFLFKWIPTSSTDSGPSSFGTPDPHFSGFFAHQVVNNACATLAVINALGNISDLNMRKDLSEMMDFTAEMDPPTRGMVVTSADWLREIHNALSPPTVFSLDGLGLPRKQEDAYHFVVYLPSFGAVYELDGLKAWPVSHGSYEQSGEGWLKTAREAIQNRIATYPPGSLEFSLLALREDPLPSLQESHAQMLSAGRDGEAAELAARISSEETKRERWAFENSLRRHNHVGFVYSLVLTLAKAGKLASATERAKETMKQRMATTKERGQDMDED